MGKGLKHFSQKDSQMAEKMLRIVILDVNPNHEIALHTH